MFNMGIYLCLRRLTKYATGILSASVPHQFVVLTPVTEHVPLRQSLCKIVARASGGANNMHPLSWGGGGRKTATACIYYTFSQIKESFLFWTRRKFLFRELHACADSIFGCVILEEVFSRI